jgi:hypothetical protein
VLVAVEVRRQNTGTLNFAICARSSVSTSARLTRRLTIAFHNRPGVKYSLPRSLTRLGILSAGETGIPSLKFRCAPIPKRGICRLEATAASKAAPFAIKVVLVTIP